MKQAYILILFLFGGITLLSGQSTGVSITAQVQLGLPQNDFKEIIDGYPAGGAFNLGIPAGAIGLFRFGGEYAWNSLNRKKSTVELLDDAQSILVGDLEKTTNVIDYLGYLRLSPFKGGFRPYGEVFVGLRSYASETNIEVDYADGSYSEAAIVLDREFKSVYGFAGGLQIGMGKHFFFDTKVQVMRGGNVSFVDSSSLQVNTSGEIDYSLKILDTDMVVPKLGLTLVF